MLAVIRLISSLIVDLFRPRATLEAELLVLRQQIIVPRQAIATNNQGHGQIGAWLAVPAVP
jgi:hypothetical protein